METDTTTVLDVISLLAFGAWGVGFYFAFKLLHRFLPVVVSKEKPKKFILKNLPLTEKLFWVGYTSLFIVITIQQTSFLVGLVFLLAFVASWRFIINLFSGIFIGLGNDYIIGQKIRYKDLAGTIKSLKITSVETELENGELLLIPNIELIRTEIIKTHPSEKIIGYSFTVSLSKPCDIVNKKEEIYQRMLLMPWLLPTEKPILEIASENETEVVIRVVIYTISPEYGLKVEQELSLLL